MGDGTQVDVINIVMQPIAVVAVGLAPTTIVDLRTNSDDHVELYNAGTDTVWVTWHESDVPAVGNGFPIKGSAGGAGGGSWSAPGGKAIIGLIQGISASGTNNIVVMRGT